MAAGAGHDRPGGGDPGPFGVQDAQEGEVGGAAGQDGGEAGFLSSDEGDVQYGMMGDGKSQGKGRGMIWDGDLRKDSVV